MPGPVARSIQFSSLAEPEFEAAAAAMSGYRHAVRVTRRHSRDYVVNAVLQSDWLHCSDGHISDEVLPHEGIMIPPAEQVVFMPCNALSAACHTLA